MPFREIADESLVLVAPCAPEGVVEVADLNREWAAGAVAQQKAEHQDRVRTARDGSQDPVPRLDHPVPVDGGPEKLLDAPGGGFSGWAGGHVDPFRKTAGLCRRSLRGRGLPDSMRRGKRVVAVEGLEPSTPRI